LPSLVGMLFTGVLRASLGPRCSATNNHLGASRWCGPMVWSRHPSVGHEGSILGSPAWDLLLRRCSGAACRNQDRCFTATPISVISRWKRLTTAPRKLLSPISHRPTTATDLRRDARDRAKLARIFNGRESPARFTFPLRTLQIGCHQKNHLGRNVFSTANRQRSRTQA